MLQNLYILNIFEALKSVIFNLKKKKVLFIMKSGKFQGMLNILKIINDNLINLEPFHVFISAMSYSRYHPSKGYSWEFSEKEEPGLCFKLHIISKLFVLPCSIFHFD